MDKWQVCFAFIRYGTVSISLSKRVYMLNKVTLRKELSCAVLSLLPPSTPCSLSLPLLPLILLPSSCLSLFYSILVWLLCLPSTRTVRSSAGLRTPGLQSGIQRRAERCQSLRSNLPASGWGCSHRTRFLRSTVVIVGSSVLWRGESC